MQYTSSHGHLKFGFGLTAGGGFSLGFWGGGSLVVVRPLGQAWEVLVMWLLVCRDGQVRRMSTPSLSARD